METLNVSTLHQHFCENVRARRRALGWTQADLAERMRVTQPVVAALEAGRRVPTLTTLEQVAAALETSVADLLDAPEKISA